MADHFRVELNDCQVLLKGLQALSFGDKVSFNITNNGIILRNQQHRTCNLSFFLEWDLFESPPVEEINPFAFAVDSKALVQFLLIFGAEHSSEHMNFEEEDSLTKLEMRFEGYGNPLLLRINKSYHVTTCKLATYEVSLESDFEVNEINAVNTAIFDAHIKDIWSDFDFLSSVLRIGFNKEDSKLTFSSDSSYAKICIELNPDTHVLMESRISQTVEYSYQMKTIQRALKALSQATRANLRVDDAGMLSIVIMIDLDSADDSRRLFAVFSCVALRDEPNQ